MTVVCDCRPFVFEKQFVCLCFSISDGAFNIGCDANLYQNGANKFPASCFIIVHNTGPINIAGCNLFCCLCLFLVTSFFVIFFRKDQKLPDVKDSVLNFFLTAALLPHLLLKSFQTGIFQWPTYTRDTKSPSGVWKVFARDFDILRQTSFLVMCTEYITSLMENAILGVTFMALPFGGSQNGSSFTETDEDKYWATS